MEAINRTNRTPNFGAKIDLQEVRSYSNRWQNIADIFEKKTNKTPQYTFYLTSDEKGVLCSIESMATNNEHSFNLDFLGLKRLMQNSDETIANTLVNALEILKKQDKIADETKKFLQRIIPKNSKKSFEKQTDQIWESVVSISDKLSEEAKANDSILKEFISID